jgi:hypothetical protein
MRTSGVAQSVGPEFKPSTKKKIKKKRKGLASSSFLWKCRSGGEQ